MRTVHVAAGEDRWVHGNLFYAFFAHRGVAVKLQHQERRWCLTGRSALHVVRAKGMVVLLTVNSILMHVKTSRFLIDADKPFTSCVCQGSELTYEHDKIVKTKETVKNPLSYRWSLIDFVS